VVRPVLDYSSDLPEDRGTSNVLMVKCPSCDLYLAEDDHEAQAIHLMANHPVLAARKLRGKDHL
jgi:hypothetical protein